MTTPPGWAHPYATFWEDFDGPYQVVEDSLSTSGGEWFTWSIDGSDTGDPLYRGATGGERNGVGAGLLVHIDAGINSGWGGVGQARAVPSGLAANNAYVRSEIFFGRSDGLDGTVNFGLTLLMDSDVYGPQFVYGVDFDLVDFFGGQAWVTTGLYLGALAPPWSDNGFEFILRMPLAWSDLTGWHRYEMRLADGEVKLLMDDVVRGTAANPLLAQAPQGVALSVSGGVRDTPADGTTAGGVNFANNFEAGPLLPPLPIPALRVAPGPISLHFQPPRLNT